MTGSFGAGPLPESADVVVIGGGVVGCAIARQLSRFELSVVLIESAPDVATGTSKANSGILHAGFDAEPGTWKARLNVRGAQLYAELAEGLGIPRKATGSLVVAKDAVQMETVADLRHRGIDNGVPGLEIWNRDQVVAHEPNISPDVAGALWAPTGAIVCPFLATVGFAENAVRNGVRIVTECAVTGFEVADRQIVAVRTTRGRVAARFVVNAAGLHSADVARLAGDDSFTIRPRRGEYILFDRSVGQLVNTVLFPTPDKLSKGILVSPTVHGNVFIGPDAVDIDDPEDRETTAGGLAGIIAGARRIVPALPLGTAITEFAGLRAAAGKDFVIGPSPAARGLVHAAGIQSPGLTSAPAIGEAIVEMLQDVGLRLRPKASFVPVNRQKPRFHDLDRQAQARLIAGDPLYGRVICRCETITEAEIIAAIQSPCGARTVDGVKRRVRAGAGRCQGGFCGPRVTAILARELGIPVTAVRKDSANSWLFLSRADLEAGEGVHA
ncbi:FAD dependent oxidoreductase [uncultured Pleomorphomonas sp.]|uniref:FAD dependent oxidoreductase n=1 Tax=uncultured Pleomorphomonas sp. TaxID=442121 RepID=A0A212L840_9HYPH|nr:NAD(P)/FAD-dependent oxidoreductase [uncultured Pleomorphomonas sp.]SCM73499.1 FAD dependent oxidoreductase [uncultured Pleomorphomonas sp.]